MIQGMGDNEQMKIDDNEQMRTNNGEKHKMNRTHVHSPSYQLFLQVQAQHSQNGEQTESVDGNGGHHDGHQTVEDDEIEKLR